VDESGNVLVRYTYQAYGTTTFYGVPTGSDGSTLRQINPLTYRGYVYDKETKLYYLQSRYYNRTSGRFINADAFTSTGQGLLGNNMFAYCGNNPVVRQDLNGMSFSIIIGINGLIFNWGGMYSINFVSTKENWGLQYSYYNPEDEEISEKENVVLGYDVGIYVGIQYTEKDNMRELEGLAEAVGGDVFLGLDFLLDENSEYFGWQFGGNTSSANVHSIYTNTETIFSVPTFDLFALTKSLIDWILGW